MDRDAREPNEQIPFLGTAVARRAHDRHDAALKRDAFFRLTLFGGPHHRNGTRHASTPHEHSGSAIHNSLRLLVRVWDGAVELLRLRRRAIPLALEPFVPPRRVRLGHRGRKLVLRVQEAREWWHRLVPRGRRMVLQRAHVCHERLHRHRGVVAEHVRAEAAGDAVEVDRRCRRRLAVRRCGGGGGRVRRVGVVGAILLLGLCGRRWRRRRWRSWRGHGLRRLAAVRARG